MKIAIDARFYGTENGGLGRYTMNLITELQKIDASNNYYLLLREPWFSKLIVTRNFTKVRVHSRHYSIAEQFEIPRAIKEIDPDLTHFLHFNVPFFFDRPYVITIHDLLMHTGVGKEATTLPRWKYLIKRLGYRLIFDHAIENARHIITPSQFVQSEIGRVYHRSKEDVSAIYEGVSVLSKQKSINPPSHTNYFLYVGNAYPHKNIKTLLRALFLINVKNSKPVKLILVAPRDVFTQRLQKEVQALQVENYVEIQNGVTDEQLQKLYEGAAAFVYPSFLEGFGLPGLEALSCNTRLIASDISVFHEVYQTHAEYFNPTSAEDLSLAMMTILSEKKSARVQKLRDASKFVKNYSWKKMAHGTLAIYETIQGRNRI